MKEFKGTKGEYRVGRISTLNNDGRFQAYVGAGVKDSPVCTVFGRTNEECDANVKLFAYTPKMLELLQFIHGYGAKCDWNKLDADIEQLLNKILD